MGVSCRLWNDQATSRGAPPCPLLPSADRRQARAARIMPSRLAQQPLVDQHRAGWGRHNPAVGISRRPRRQVHRRVRRRLHGDRHPHHPETSAGAAGQRNRRTLRRHHPPRAPRPHPRHQPAACRNRTDRVRRALQQPPATPHARPGRSPPPTPPAHDEPVERRPTTGPARRPAPRVSAGRVTCAPFPAPAGPCTTPAPAWMAAHTLSSSACGAPGSRTLGRTRRWSVDVFELSDRPLLDRWEPVSIQMPIAVAASPRTPTTARVGVSRTGSPSRVTPISTATTGSTRIWVASGAPRPPVR